jgi:hypothetical protein
MVDCREEDERRNGDVSSDEGEGFCGGGRHRKFVEWVGYDFCLVFGGRGMTFMREWPETRAEAESWWLMCLWWWLHVRTLEAAFVVESLAPDWVRHKPVGRERFEPR